MKLSTPKPTREMLPAATPAAIAIQPSRVFQPMVKYSRRLPRAALCCRSDRAIRADAIERHRLTPVRSFQTKLNADRQPTIDSPRKVSLPPGFKTPGAPTFGSVTDPAPNLPGRTAHLAGARITKHGHRLRSRVVASLNPLERAALDASNRCRSDRRVHGQLEIRVGCLRFPGSPADGKRCKDDHCAQITSKPRPIMIADSAIQRFAFSDPRIQGFTISDPRDFLTLQLIEHHIHDHARN